MSALAAGTGSTPRAARSLGRAQARRVAEATGREGMRLHTTALLHEPHRLQDLSGGSVGTFAVFRHRLAGLGAALVGYAAVRDRLDGTGGSVLSPHLSWGEIAPWVVGVAGGRGAAHLQPRRLPNRTEVLWREFAHHRLWWDGDLDVCAVGWEPAWGAVPGDLRAWRWEQTRVLAVDAGKRQLWREGWISNRARLLAAALLTKHLLLDWRAGEACFWDTLVDACLANNPFSW